MTKLTLTEYKPKSGVCLTREQVAALLAIVPSLRLAFSAQGSNLYDLTPGSEIGAVKVDDLALVIRPKVTKLERVLFMISYSLDPKRWWKTGFDFDEQDSIVEAIIPGFVHHLRRAFRRGVLQGYRQEEDALPAVRGRIRFDDQIRDRFGLVPPAEVRFDEFTEDIELNRILKAALVRLNRLKLRATPSRRGLRAFLGSLERVELQEYSPHSLPRFTFNRLNEHYRPAVQLAELVLQSTSPELVHGTQRSTCFLVDMNKVFEDFVVTALREDLGLSETVLRQGDKKLRLDEAGSVHLEPDLSWWIGDRCCFVGDVKYKEVNVPGIKHPDLYQLLAYTVASDLPGGLLIYAAGEGHPASHEIVNLGKKLHVISLNLGGEPQEILREIHTVGQQIRALRHAASIDSLSVVSA